MYSVQYYTPYYSDIHKNAKIKKKQKKNSGIEWVKLGLKLCCKALLFKALL